MNKKELAKMLTGRQSGKEITKEECELAKENGLVVVFRSRDGRIDFRGAIHDEIESVEETTITFLNGIIADYKCDIEEFLGNLREFKIPTPQITTIDLIQDSKIKKYEWSFEADISTFGFSIMLDNKRYCLGIIFDIKDMDNDNRY